MFFRLKHVPSFLCGWPDSWLMARSKSQFLNNTKVLDNSAAAGPKKCVSDTPALPKKKGMSVRQRLDRKIIAKKSGAIIEKGPFARLARDILKSIEPSARLCEKALPQLQIGAEGFISDMFVRSCQMKNILDPCRKTCMPVDLRLALA